MAKDSKPKEGPNILKALVPSMVSGLLVGSGKGWSEKAIERVMDKVMKRLPDKTRMAKGIRGIPWATARGTTSALAGIPYTISAVIAARELSKGKKD